MKKTIIVFFTMLMLISMSFAQQKQTPQKSDSKKADKVEFKWYTFEEAVALNKKNPKKIFIDIFTDWCGWCVKMDNSTWQDSIIKSYLAKNFYPVRLNAERKDTVRFNGNVYVNPSPDKPRSTHQLAVSLLQGQLSYPSYVILNEKLEILNMYKGYKVPKEMECVLHYIADGSYAKMTYEKYSATFKGSF